MDLETRVELVKSVGEEIITEQELRELLGTKLHPVAYDGFEPSGLAHLPFGVFRPLLLKDLIKAGVHFKLWLADSFAWINNKMGGDLNKIRKVGEYFIEVWKAAGVDEKKVEFLWASDAFSDKEYWKKVILIAKHTTVHRAARALTIMGRKEGELVETAQYFYPMMQTADIFHLKADICQLGLDQRRANIIAREVGPKLGWWKPVVVSHHMLMGLEGAKQPEGYETSKEMDVEITSKMSKSKPQTAIFVHDSLEEIKQKIRIRIRSYDNKIIDSSARQIVETAQRQGAEVVGPIPMPTEIKKYTVNSSTFVHKNSRDQYEMRVHKRLIDIMSPSAKTIDALMNLNLPAGVDIEIKM